MNATNVQMGDWLGLPPPATEAEMLRIVEAKLAPAVIKRRSRSASSARRLTRPSFPSERCSIAARGEKLTVEESDRVLRVIRVISLAESVYGSRERALAWLRHAHPRLSGRSPLSLLNTDAGSRIVEELLIQIDEGMFVSAMILWRISRHRDLSGIGGLKAAGRWHHAGLPIVYVASSPSAALLEVCVHTSANDIPPEFTLLKIDGPEVKVLTVRPEELPSLTVV